MINVLYSFERGSELEYNIRRTLVQILIGNCCYDCSVCLFVLFLLAELAGGGAEHTGKKIWSSMHPINFGSDKIRPYVHTYVSTLTPSC